MNPLGFDLHDPSAVERAHFDFRQVVIGFGGWFGLITCLSLVPGLAYHDADPPN